MKRLLMFDFFGVIGAEISPRWFRNHFPIEEAKILKDQYFEPADLGEYTIYETLERIAKDFNFKVEDIIKEWKSYVAPNQELLNKILKLKEKNTICLLSNAADGIFELLYPDIDFNLYFDKVFISCYHKMKKPDIRFYLKAVEAFHENFDEIYFIDDNQKNIDCLEKTKIKGILYRKNEEVFQILDSFM